MRARVGQATPEETRRLYDLQVDVLYKSWRDAEQAYYAAWDAAVRAGVHPTASVPAVAEARRIADSLKQQYENATKIAGRQAGMPSPLTPIPSEGVSPFEPAGGLGLPPPTGPVAHPLGRPPGIARGPAPKSAADLYELWKAAEKRGSPQKVQDALRIQYENALRAEQLDKGPADIPATPAFYDLASDRARRLQQIGLIAGQAIAASFDEDLGRVLLSLGTTPLVNLSTYTKARAEGKRPLEALDLAGGSVQALAGSLGVREDVAALALNAQVGERVLDVSLFEPKTGRQYRGSVGEVSSIRETPALHPVIALGLLLSPAWVPLLLLRR